ncbi:hypothetical protein PGTUg99_017988 [Puccinia graminis f. sp. tritici]|nr:hypothetical protein PGTUg99_017988 [Puccinia graminis f. sp. tritici]
MTDAQLYGSPVSRQVIPFGRSKVEIGEACTCGDEIKLPFLSYGTYNIVKLRRSGCEPRLWTTEWYLHCREQGLALLRCRPSLQLHELEVCCPHSAKTCSRSRISESALRKMLAKALCQW